MVRHGVQAVLGLLQNCPAREAAIFVKSIMDAAGHPSMAPPIREIRSE